MPVNPLSTPVGVTGSNGTTPGLPPLFNPPRSSIGRFRPRSSLHNSFSFDSHDQRELLAAIDTAAGIAASRNVEEDQGGVSYASSSHQAILADLAAEQGNSGLSQVSPRMVGPPLADDEPSSKRRKIRMSGVSDMSSGLSSASPLPPARGIGRRKGQDLLQGLMKAGRAARTSTPAREQPGAEESGVATEQDAEAEEEEDDPTWRMIARMRTWRHDAILQHLYETAAFWGDKIFAWTGDPNDAFWLAQTHFLTQHYLRAEQILTSTLPPSRMPRLEGASTSTSAPPHTRHGKGKAKVTDQQFSLVSENGYAGFDSETSIIGELAELGGVWGVISGGPDSMAGKRMLGRDEGDVSAVGVERGGVLGEGTRLIDWSVACRYLAAQCMIHQEKLQEALDLLGPSNVFASTGRSGTKVPSKNGDLKLEASICRLRAILHLRLSSFALAKESFMEALALDVRNYDAFKELIDGGMMTPEEEWEFIDNLSYNHQLAEDDAAFVKLMYQSRLNKHAHGKEIAAAGQRLQFVYNLGENPDVVVATAEDLYAKYKWQECYAVTSSILAKVPGHSIALPIHLACMSQIPRLSSSLFMLAHQLVEQEPDSALTWYAVGLWYFSGQRWTEARRYFSKASLMDPRFGPAWITFAHSFAYEGEHEQAITAYSTSARLFPGSHLPHLFIGMEYLQLSNYSLAEESFQAAKSLFADDPLLLNELGVASYNKNEFREAIDYFNKALSGAVGMQGAAGIWAGTHCNLGHAYRQLLMLTEARNSYLECIKLDALNVCAFTSLGLITHQQGDVRRSIDYYHEALAVAPQDPMATVLLEIALKAQIELGALSFPGLPASLVAPELDPFKEPRGNRLLQVEEEDDDETASVDDGSAMDITAEDGHVAASQEEPSEEGPSGAGDGSSMDISQD